jgi:hypothetical protein
MAVLTLQRLADGAGVLAPQQRAIKLPPDWTIEDHPQDSLAGTVGGDGEVTGYLELVPPPLLRGAAKLSIPLYVGGAGPTPSSGAPGWGSAAISIAPQIAAVEIVGAQDVLPGATQVLLRAVFVGGFVDISTDGATEVAGSLLTNTTNTIQQLTADVSSVYAGTGQNTILLDALLRMWCPGTLIAPASNGATLPQSTIHVQSVANLAASGSVTIGSDTVTYTSTTGGGSPTLNGCSGGSGTLSTGEKVTQGEVVLCKAELLLS